MTCIADGSDVVLPGAGPGGADVIIDDSFTSGRDEWQFRLEADGVWRAFELQAARAGGIEGRMPRFVTAAVAAAVALAAALWASPAAAGPGDGGQGSGGSKDGVIRASVVKETPGSVVDWVEWMFLADGRRGGRRAQTWVWRRGLVSRAG